MKCITKNLIIQAASEATDEWKNFHTRRYRVDYDPISNQVISWDIQNIIEWSSSFYFLGILFVVELIKNEIEKLITIYPFENYDYLIKFNIQ